jgi:hypothetical protein
MPQATLLPSNVKGKFTKQPHELLNLISKSIYPRQSQTMIETKQFYGNDPGVAVQGPSRLECCD